MRGRVAESETTTTCRDKCLVHPLISAFTQLLTKQVLLRDPRDLRRRLAIRWKLHPPHDIHCDLSHPLLFPFYDMYSPADLPSWLSYSITTHPTGQTKLHNSDYVRCLLGGRVEKCSSSTLSRP
jgi:hypothetical protein